MFGGAMCLADIASPDGGGEAVFAVVGAGKNFLGIAKGHGGDDGPENLFLHDLHVFARVDENSGLDKISLVALLMPTGNGSCALRESSFEITADAAQLLLGDERAHLGIEIGIFVDDIRRLAPELERNFFQVPSRGVDDELANFRGTGECNLVDVRMSGEGGTGGFTVSGYDVDNALREAGIHDEFSETERGEWRLLGRL